MDLSHSLRGKIYRNITAKIRGMEEYNDLFWKTYDLLEETKSWSTLQFREYQLQKLKELIDYAYANTKYYRRMFDEYGWTPRDFRNFHDIRKIPILTKDILEKNLKNML